MKRDYGPMPATREEAMKVLLSLREEDIDLTDMPDRGDSPTWRPFRLEEHLKRRSTVDKEEPR
ncbi:MAG: hypothetical protein LBR38_09630 [Synergistaceae bacterium]|jgi:hypothetical protein|nr:hypothetical protein [Synergistaceae bacterium]